MAIPSRRFVGVPTEAACFRRAKKRGCYGIFSTWIGVNPLASSFLKGLLQPLGLLLILSAALREGVAVERNRITHGEYSRPADILLPSVVLWMGIHLDGCAAASLLDKFKDLPDRITRPQTFMEIGGYPHYENVCSNFLAFFLDPAGPHGLDPSSSTPWHIHPFLWRSSLHLSSSRRYHKDPRNVS